MTTSRTAAKPDGADGPADQPSPEKLRAWWWHRQGLDGTLRGSDPATVLDRAGWARSVGGANPYLSLRARGGSGRAETEAAVADLTIHELPSARGCTYVLPARDYALGLRLALGPSGAEVKTVEKLGVPRSEIDALCDRVVEVLGSSPLSPAALKDALGDAVRSLGEEGKKKGSSTTLPAALGVLQAQGRIRRVPVDGRLDQQRYNYVAWPDAPAAELSADEAATRIAERYWSWTGPASLAHFRWFTAFGATAAKKAVEPLGLVPVAPGSELLIRPQDQEVFNAFSAPDEPSYQLIAALDSLFLLRRDLSWHIAAEDAEREALGRRIGALADLNAGAIVDRGRVVGLWEYDAEAAELVWASFVPVTAALREAVAETEAFARDELGDVRSMSLDSPASRRPRIEALRKLAAG